MKKVFIGLLLEYLRQAARVQLTKIRPKHIIGITGSAGKSSCREAVDAILKEKYQVKQSSSGNSETGLPLDILGFTGEHNYGFWYWLEVIILVPWKLITNWERYDIYLAEMGVDSPDEPKNMSYLLKILQPDIGVFLNALSVHTEYFPEKSESSLVKAIAAEKGKLIKSLPRDGWAVLNIDDPNVAAYKTQDTKSKVITFGKTGDVKPFLVDLPGYLLTQDYRYTLAAAAAVGKIFGVSLEESRQLLKKNFRLPPGRMSVFPGINGSTIIDSSYNSSKRPAISALEALRKFQGKRKIAVIGDMRELGDLAKNEHEEVAAAALKNVDYIFTFGPLTEKYFPDSTKIRKFRKMTELVKAAKNFLKSGDVILVKGSQNTILLETLVEALLKNPDDKNKLCRSGNFWNQKRKELLSEVASEAY